MGDTDNKSDFIELFIKVHLFIRRHWILLLIFCGLGLLYGIYKVSSTAPYYNTSLILKSSEENAGYISDLLKYSDNYLSDSTLFADKELYHNVQASFANIKSIHVATDGLEITRVNLSIFDPDKDLKKLQEDIILFITDNEMHKSWVEKSSANLKSQASAIDHELDQIDSLKESILSRMHQSSQNNVMVSSNAFGISNDLLSRKAELLNELESINRVAVVKGIHKPGQQAESGRMTVIFAIVLFFVIGVIVALYIDFRRIMRERIR